MTPDTLPAEFVERFLINGLLLLVLLRLVYFRFSANRDSLFGFFLFGHGVYLISALMHDVDISMGFAFGLFAVLSMLRYRTESLSVRDMTYLFVVIVMSLTAAVGPVDVLGIALLNGALCAIVAIAETTFFAPRTVTRTVLYDDASKARPDRLDALRVELGERLGVTVLHVDVGSIDLLRDCATLRITHAAQQPSRAAIESDEKRFTELPG